MIRVVFTLLAVLLVLGQPLLAEASEFGSKVSQMAEIKAVRVGAAADRVRIVVDAAKEVRFKTLVLSNPGRVVVDLAGAWLSPNVSRDISLDSPFASRIRVGQFDKTTVRIVVETTVQKDQFEVFPIAGGEDTAPYRVVMDFGRTGEGNTEYGTRENPAASLPDDEAETPREKPPTGSGVESEQTTEAGKVSPEEIDEDGKPSEKEKKKEDKKGDKAKDEAKKTAAEEKDEPPSEPVFSPGIKGKKIVIDPGHGGEDSGAIGPTGVTEKSVTLRISKEIKTLLEKAGAKVIMTREIATEVSPKHRQATDIDELQARCDVANKAKADIFVSIHTDSFTSREASGTTGYYYEKGTAASRRLAKAIQSALIKEIRTTSRGIKTCNFYVVRKTNMPATLIEVAFLSNPKEEKLLNSKQGVLKAAVGIVQGISDFFGK